VSIPVHGINLKPKIIKFKIHRIITHCISQTNQAQVAQK